MAEETKKYILEGSTGTSMNSGYISEERIAALQGVEWAKIADELTDSDDMIAAIETAIENPILGATYYFDKGKAKDELCAKIKDFVEWAFFTQMDRPFLDYVMEYLTIKKYGYYLVNPVMGVVTHPEFGKVNIIKHLSFRKPSTIYRWEVEKGTEKLLRVYQQTDSSDNAFNGWLDAKNLKHLALKRTGTNFEGRSFYRPIYGNYVRKKLMQKIKVQSVERAGLGFPIIYYPSTWKEGSEQMQAIKRAAAGIASHKNAYLLLPEGVKVEYGDIPAKIAEIKDTIHDENIAMARRALADFLTMGQTGGSYAMVKDKTEMFSGPIQYLAYYWLDNIIDPLAADMVRWNFPSANYEHYPASMASGIEKKAKTEMATLMKTLKGSGFLRIDEDLYDFTRDYFDLPDENKEKLVEEAPEKKDSEEPKDSEEEAPEKIEKLSERRALSKYEAKVDFDFIDEELNQLSREMNDIEEFNLRKMVEVYINDIKQSFIKNNVSLYETLKTIQPPTDNFQSGMIRSIKRHVISGKNEVEKEIKGKQQYADDYKLKPSIFAWVIMESDRITRNKARKLSELAENAGMSKASFFPIGQILTSAMKYAILSEIEGAIKDFISNKSHLSSAAISNRAYNIGRKDIDDTSVIGFEYSAILDNVTTDICEELDGQTREINDLVSAELDPPNHFNCRSILVPILAGEEVEWTGFRLKTASAKAQWQF